MDDAGPQVAADTPDTPPSGSAGRPSPPRRGYLVPGLIALAVLAVLAVLIDVIGLQHHAPRVLAGPDVATLIAQDMQTRDASRQPPQIRCPTSEPVRVGLRFTCEVENPSGNRTVRVEVTSSQGTFTWQELPGPSGGG